MTTPKTPEEYKAAYDRAKLLESKKEVCSIRASKLYQFKDTHYGPVAAAIWRDASKWWVVACIHNQECGSDVGVFKAVLHNGEKIVGTGKKTSLVPKGRGPFRSWTEAAIDALSDRHNEKLDLGSALSFFERYNGLGYRKHGVMTPYVWAMTDQYTKGHYAGDGNWRPDEISQNFGVAAILKAMELKGYLNLSIVIPETSTNPAAPENSGDYIARLLRLADSVGCHALAARMVTFMGASQPRYTTIFDVSKSATEKRLHVLDLKANSVLSITCGVGSGSDPNGDGIATSFSNTQGSHQTSLGVFRYAEVNKGSKHTAAVMMDGLESTNSNMRVRSIETHTADYVTDSRAGRTDGCQGVALKYKDLVLSLANGSYGIIGKS